MPQSRAVAVLALGMCLGLSGCIYKVRRVEPGTLEPLERVTTPVRAYLRDGSVAVFHAGVILHPDSLVGVGERYDLRLQSAGTTLWLPLDSVAALYGLRNVTDGPKSTALSLAVTVGFLATIVALGAESFTIGPIFEPQNQH